MKNIKYWIWLSIFDFQPIDKIRLLQIFDNDPQKIYETNKEILLKKLLYNDFSDKKSKNICEKIEKSKMYNKLNEYEKILRENGIKAITYLDDKYPKKLLNIYDFPIVLYVKGNDEILNKKSRKE